MHFAGETERPSALAPQFAGAAAGTGIQILEFVTGFDLVDTKCSEEETRIDAPTLLALAWGGVKPVPKMGRESREVVAQAIGAENRDVVRRQALLEAMGESEGVID